MQNFKISDLPENIQDKIIPEPMSGCWIWIGCQIDGGYGRLTFMGRLYLAHRLIYQLFKGNVNDGIEICHSCDLPACVNPYHTFGGTRIDNMRDMVSKDRANKPQGTKNHFAKLEEDAVRSIINDHRPNSLIADDYGVTKATIAKIKRGETWSHLFHDDGDPHFIPVK